MATCGRESLTSAALEEERGQEGDAFNPDLQGTEPSLDLALRPSKLSSLCRLRFRTVQKKKAFPLALLSFQA